MNAFAERLKELRQERNLTQQQLCINLKFKISQSCIVLYENGKRQPTLNSLILLAQYFGVSLDYLAGLED